MAIINYKNIDLSIHVENVLSRRLYIYLILNFLQPTANSQEHSKVSKKLIPPTQLNELSFVDVVLI